MRVLYFDCFSGISGDMVLGALLDLGVNAQDFRRELGKLNLSGYDIVIERKVKNSITVTDVDVILDEDSQTIHSKGNEQGHSENLNHCSHNNSVGHFHNDHEHQQHCNQKHQNQHDHDHNARNLKDIEILIDASDLKNTVKDFSKKVFREIARAEAKVHNKAIEEVHFHEVGAVDSIVDIVGTAICLDLLGVDKVYSSPLHDGTGFIECRHGRLPVPVPAVMEMLTDGNIPYIAEDINTELVTPTGIGIIKCLTEDFGSMPALMVNKVGYGGGKRDTGRLNALRCILGTMAEMTDTREEIIVLETNIDDMSPEVLGFVMDKLFEQGALDVFYTPVYMKKNRPAVVLTALCKKDSEQVIVDTILKETSSLGIRKTISERYTMDREIVKVNTEFGEVGVKVSSFGDFKKFAPEYEDCRKIAISNDIPLWKVYNAVYKKGI
ncbi:nickel pincer cofactor biosynthesis protein LarC [Acetivibrio cellulolyticus]|uniref:nickel pincer cofactor biosynthesis protein LarC n=1 Tax=Acetivibrio cellulolyticus TaxID=35830 RepID=UPI0001E30585|nr:nickel pincer cofactor biosynthesis protein LarC [Acetivibrio cellulolyticus]